MNRIDKYLFKTVLSAILVVLLIVCALDSLSKIIEEIEELENEYSFSEILIYVGLLFPLTLYRYMPFAALVGSLIGLGSLAANSELTAIRAAGVSMMQIVRSVLKPVLFIILFSLFLAEFVVPITEQIAENRRSLKLDGDNVALSSTRGLWNREGNEYMHFNSVQPNGRLLGITRYEYDENQQLIASSFSQSATYVGDYWLEENVIETRLQEENTETITYPVRRWDAQISPLLLTVLIQQSDNLAISQLKEYIGYLQNQNIDSGLYELSFWNKVLQPFAIVSLVLIAISFIFGSLREVTMGYRIFIGVVVGLGFQIAQRLLGPTSLVYEFPPVIAVAIPIVICFLVGSYILIKKR